MQNMDRNRFKQLEWLLDELEILMKAVINRALLEMDRMLPEEVKNSAHPY